MGRKTLKNGEEYQHYRRVIDAYVGSEVCIECHNRATKFRSRGNYFEYRISGFCEKCQDVLWEGKDSIGPAKPKSRTTHKGRWINNRRG